MYWNEEQVRAVSIFYDFLYFELFIIAFIFILYASYSVFYFLLFFIICNWFSL